MQPPNDDNNKREKDTLKMKPQHAEDTDKLLDELHEMADEVLAVRKERPSMKTYSRIHGKIRPNVAPTYKRTKYPLFAHISRITFDGPIDRDDPVQMEVLRAMRRAKTAKV